MRLDHLLWAGPDLDVLADTFQRLTGITPEPGGAHPGFGTRNRLVGLTDGIYLELIAPDPEQDLTDTMGAALSRLEGPQMLTVALRTTDLEAAAQAARGAGVFPGPPVAMNRTRPDGVRLDWSIMRFEDPDRALAMPFLIDWQDAPHPSEMLSARCALESLTMIDPDPQGFARFFEALGADMTVAGGVRLGAVAQLSTPQGTVVLT